VGTRRADLNAAARLAKLAIVHDDKSRRDQAHHSSAGIKLDAGKIEGAIVVWIRFEIALAGIGYRIRVHQDVATQ
jgi:hypothetical protein